MSTKTFLSIVLSTITLSVTSFVFAADPTGGSAKPEEGHTEDRGGHVRWGVAAGVGAHVPQLMFTVGLQGHLGYQISSRFSVYGTLGCALGFPSNTGFVIGDVETRGSSLYYCSLGALGEAAFGDLFYVGAGPVLT